MQNHTFCTAPLQKDNAARLRDTESRPLLMLTRTGSQYTHLLGGPAHGNIVAAGSQHSAGRNHDLNFCVDQLFPEVDFDQHGLGDDGLADADLLNDLHFELDGTDPVPS